MKVYIVRDVKTKRFQGVFWANSKAEIWDTFDEFGDPYGYEFACLKNPGALVHPSDGVAIPQWGDADDDEDAPDMSWAEFRESECFLVDLMCQNRMKWEPFCHAGEKYGLLARIKRQVDWERIETNDNDAGAAEAA